MRRWGLEASVVVDLRRLECYLYKRSWMAACGNLALELSLYSLEL